MGDDFAANFLMSASVTHASFCARGMAASRVLMPSNFIKTASVLLILALSTNHGRKEFFLSSMKIVCNPFNDVFFPNSCCRSNSPFMPYAATNFPILKYSAICELSSVPDTYRG